jgi:o-succinylbenzoate synthase
MQITSVEIQEHTLRFRFEAGTSRGTLKEKKTWYLKLYNEGNLIGIGEAGPLKGLSIEKIDEMPAQLELLKSKLKGEHIPDNMEAVLELAEELTNDSFPSIRFAVETALLNALYKGKVIFPSDFVRNEKRIPINGLIWMGEKGFMQQQIEEKTEAGFNCIKMKIGAIDFETELELLKSIRDQANEDQMILRVDANGAFDPANALDKLDQLSALGIHSIEQPIKAGQINKMKALCKESSLPIALDEELIGVNNKADKKALLAAIQPQYIILKPSLIGGVKSTLEWVQIAESLSIGWWMTSMLESNIGLNAICQLADYLQVEMHQGLGTGQLYHNNIDSPLTIKKGHIYYDLQKSWGSLDDLN